jgi:hypothetical protein
MNRMAWLRCAGHTNRVLHVEKDGCFIPYTAHPLYVPDGAIMGVPHSKGWATYQRLLKAGYTLITEAEAKAKYQELQDLIHPQVGLALLQGLIGTDLSSYPLDEPLPDLPETNDNKSRQALLIDIARKHNFTIRELYQWIAGARGHWTIIGTPVQIADQLESWFVNDAADGFNIMPPYLPGGLDDFVDLVIPELQRRGLFRTEYEGTTLRENLGLRRPANRFAVKQQEKTLAFA